MYILVEFIWGSESFFHWICSLGRFPRNSKDLHKSKHYPVPRTERNLMGSGWFRRLLLVWVLLVLSFSLSHGFNRKAMETFELVASSVQPEETAGQSREMLQLLDYNLEPQPNINPKTGYIYSPPPEG